MRTIDWIVVTIYMIGMLAIGEYYARRTKSDEDYLLGGRNMGFMSIGMSLFAALLSTISCLAVPGEMIRHGPMIFAESLACPLVYLVVGFLIIPAFMKQRVTSAYEILENRFGVGVRMLGATLFLSLRLLWMGVLVYATAHEVLIPLTGLPDWATPIVCLVMGAVTVVYTSMGGLRAVVVTDVIQESILLIGIALTIVVTTVALGGVGAWWPDQWLSHWDPLTVGVDTKARVSIPIAVLGGFLWWTCTAGSDQIAIQRYFATRDAKTARHALGVSLVAGVLAIVLLACVGLSVLAYFNRFPEKLAEGTDVYRDADKLFARFIVVGLPPGITGLVIAGLVATAMSSLSSGINSACSVITADFVDRFSHFKERKIDHLRRTKMISWIIGILVILSSAVVGLIPGNLMEISYKTVQLLVAPLFVLFFMAMFVPWANSFGTFVAAAVSTAVAVYIAFAGWFFPDRLGLSFIWILPASLAAGMVVGPLVSLIPLVFNNRSANRRN